VFPFNVRVPTTLSSLQVNSPAVILVGAGFKKVSTTADPIKPIPTTSNIMELSIDSSS